MEVILDTNALSAFADGDLALKKLLGNVDEIWIPSIVLGEFRFGIAQSKFRAAYEAWLDLVATDARVLSVGSQTAVWYGDVRLALKQSGRPIPYHDIWIAALALEKGYSVLTRDRHFDFVKGVERIEW